MTHMASSHDAKMRTEINAHAGIAFDNNITVVKTFTILNRITISWKLQIIHKIHKLRTIYTRNPTLRILYYKSDNTYEPHPLNMRFVVKKIVLLKG